MPSWLKVLSKEPPWGTETVCFPLIVMFTLPLGDKYFFATSSMITNTRMITKNTAMLAIIKFISIV